MNFQEYKKLFKNPFCRCCVVMDSTYKCIEHYVDLMSPTLYFIYNNHQYVITYNNRITGDIKHLEIYVSSSQSSNAFDYIDHFDELFSVELESIKVDSLSELQNFIIRKYIDNLIFQ